MSCTILCCIKQTQGSHGASSVARASQIIGVSVYFVDTRVRLRKIRNKASIRLVLFCYWLLTVAATPALKPKCIPTVQRGKKIRFQVFLRAKHVFFRKSPLRSSFLFVPQTCTDLDFSLLYILTVGTYSKFARENNFPALGVCSGFPQPCSSAGRRFSASRSFSRTTDESFGLHNKGHIRYL